MAILTLENCATPRTPGRLLRRIDRVMTSLIEAQFEALDISFTQWVALKVTRDGITANAGELARELNITTGATTRMIDALETRGLMARDRGSADRRVVRLSITEAGRAAVAELQLHVIEAWNEVLAGFEQAEVDRMTDGLVRLLAAAESIAARVQGDRA